MSLDWSLRCEHCHSEFYSANVTHNLGDMWRAAGCRGPLYYWEGRKAEEALPVLRLALSAMQDNPAQFEALNPENGWGDYDGAKQWLSSAIDACVKSPKAVIDIRA